MTPRIAALMPFFLSVARTGSLTSASLERAITQPALSRKIGQIERELGVSLFERHARGMTLTHAGEILLRRASLMEQEGRRAVEELQFLRGSATGRLVVVAGPAWHLTVLPGAIAEVCAAYPGYSIELRMSGSVNDIEAVERGEVDLYAGSIGGAHAASSLIIALERKFRYQVFARRGHALRARSSIPLGDLGAWPWASYVQDGSWPFIENILRRAGDSGPSLTALSDSLPAAMAIAAAGDHLIGLTHPLTAIARTYGVVPLPVQPLDFEFASCVAYRPSSIDLPPFALLLEAMKRRI